MRGFAVLGLAILLPVVARPGPAEGRDLSPRPASGDSILGFISKAAAASPHVRWFAHGASHEGHPLGYAALGSTDHLDRLEEVRAGIRRLADPGRPVPRDSLELLLTRLPALVWLSASVHGDELAPADAACRLVSLLIADDPTGRARVIRDSLVILIDPLRNPDGRARALAERRQWQSAQPVADDESYHHREAWPDGRGNHYFIDLNRDGWQLAQPETRLRAREIVGWQPQVVIDMHEMRADDTYLFSPPAPPAPPYVARTVDDWWDRFSRAIAGAMSDRGQEYYRGEWHEAFAPDRFVAWSLHSGATAVLLEVPGVDGTAVERSDGTTLTFEDTVNRHLDAVLAILETAAMNRRQLLSDFHAFRKEVTSGKHLEPPDEGGIPLSGDLSARVTWLREGEGEREASSGTLRGSKTRSFLLPPGVNETRRRGAVELLLRQGIEVRITDGEITVRRAVDPEGAVQAKQVFPAGTCVIDLHQPLGALAAMLLDPAPMIDESSLLKERRGLLLGGETAFASYTAWSLPGWAGLPAWSVPAAVRGGEPIDLRHHVWPSAISERGTGPRHHAILMDSGDDASLVAALRLLASGVGLRASSESFTADGRIYQAGSIIVPSRTELPESEVLALCRDAGARPSAVGLGLTDAGPDLGSRRVVSMKLPRIAVLAGFGTSSQALGRTWFFFDRQVAWPVTLLPIQRLHSADLGAYNVIILPEAPRERGPRLAEIIGALGWDRLLDWVSFGGTLVLCGESIASLPRGEPEARVVHIGLRRDLLPELPLISRRLLLEMRSMALLDRRDATALGGSGSRNERARGATAELLAGERELWAIPEGATPEDLVEWDESERRFAPRGVFMRLRLPDEHWLVSGLGHRPSIPVWTRQAYHALPPARALARFEIDRDLCASGLLWPEAMRRWEASAALIRERVGSGQVIAIAGDFTRGSPVLDRLILNAAVLGPALVER